MCISDGGVDTCFWVAMSLCLPPSSADGGDLCGLARSRSKREKREKVGRKSALEQLKKAKLGEKIKYEVKLLLLLLLHLWMLDNHCVITYQLNLYLGNCYRSNCSLIERVNTR